MTSRYFLVSITIACSSFWGCATGAGREASLPGLARYAPASVTPTSVPEGDATKVRQASSLGLDALLVHADAHAPELALARASLGHAKADRVEADIPVPSNPTLSLEVGPRVQGGVGVDVGVGVSQELEVSGQVAARKDAAVASLELGAAQVELARWRVHVEVHRLYVAILLNRERQVLARQFVTFADAHRENARKRVEADDLSPLAMLIADADAARAREVLIGLAQREKALRIRMSARVGWPSSQALPPITGTLGRVRHAPSSASLRSVMLKNHPALRVEELSVSSARAQHRVAVKEGAPRPTFGVSVGQESSPGGAGAWLGLATLEVPLALWRWNQSEILRAETQVRQADATRDLLVVRLERRLREATSVVDAAADRVALYETGVVPHLEKSFELLRRAFELGEADVHQVSQTQRRLLEAMRQYFEARSVYHEGAIALEGIVGSDPWSQP